VPSFIADPAWCEITYSYTVSHPKADKALSFNESTQTFEFEQLDDLSLSGSVSKDYTITVTGVAGNNSLVSSEASFTLSLQNPCIDPMYVTIQSEALPVGETYILHDTRHDFAHSSFTVITNPFAHSLCGDLAYTTTFVGATIDLISDPMTYDTTTRTFSLYSEDFNLLGM